MSVFIFPCSITFIKGIFHFIMATINFKGPIFINIISLSPAVIATTSMIFIFDSMIRDVII